jgi:hypothetical protein
MKDHPLLSTLRNVVQILPRNSGEIRLEIIMRR